MMLPPHPQTTELIRARALVEGDRKGFKEEELSLEKQDSAWIKKKSLEAEAIRSMAHAWHVPRTGGCYTRTE